MEVYVVSWEFVAQMQNPYKYYRIATHRSHFVIGRANRKKSDNAGTTTKSESRIKRI